MNQRPIHIALHARGLAESRAPATFRALEKIARLPNHAGGMPPPEASQWVEDVLRTLGDRAKPLPAATHMSTSGAGDYARKRRAGAAGLEEQQTDLFRKRRLAKLQA